jgi:pseudouridine kinase
MMIKAFARSPESPALVIGAAGVDIVGRLRAELRPATSTPAQIRSSFGGVARNVAENLARLGQAVTLITAVGQDEDGQRLIQALQAAGVDTQAILCTDQYATGAYLGVLNPDGSLQFALDDMRAINALTPDYLRQHADLFKSASLLFIDANLPKETLRTALALARQARLPVCADPTSASLAARLIPYLSRLYLIAPNAAEAEILCGEGLKITSPRQAIRAAKHLVSQGVEIAIVTLAERGVCYATSETSGHIPAIHTPITDPTGAGDALTATVIFALLNDIPLDDAVRLGVSAASLTLRYRGAVVPDLSLEKLYDLL